MFALNWVVFFHYSGMIDGNDTIVPDVTMVKAISIKTPAGNTYKPAGKFSCLRT